MNQNKKIQKIVYTALFAALTCVATMIFQIPSPVNGYIHLGDTFVIMSGILLGSTMGGLAAGIGSMFADIFTSYAFYAPGTFFIKFLAAFVAAFVFRKICSNFKDKLFLGTLMASLSSAVIVVFGYFIYASIFLGKGLGAAASIPGNLVQTIGGTIITCLLCNVIKLLHSLTE